MPRPCLGCGRRIQGGSYCGGCAPGRVRGRAGQQIRVAVLQAFAYRCADCGAEAVPLEVHHIDREVTNNAVGNLLPLCRPCHARAGRLR